jgi:predicted amidohydrolase YtcJ
MPGITDGHAHADREALRNVFPSLGRVRSIGDIKDRIAELARGKRPGEWIVTMPIGEPPYYFDVPDILAEKRWPTRHDLDSAAPNNPVYIRSIWGFWRGTPPLVSCANTEALRRAGITRDTVSPVEALTIEKMPPSRPAFHQQDPADCGADLVSRRDRLHACRPHARAAGIHAPLPFIRHHQHV